jgi:transposase
MGNYLKMEKIQQIQALTRLGWPARAISRHTGIDRGTISKYLKAKQSQDADSQNQPEVPTDPLSSSCENQPEVPAGFPALVATNSVQIQPYTQTIRDKLLQKLCAQRIYQDLVESHGYGGSYDSVKRYVRKLRKKARRFVERLEHSPGREAQVDFGKAPCRVLLDGKWKRPWLFKMTLSCSKHAYEELVWQQDFETFIRCHERAFASFNGVPEIVTPDNLKAAVITASLYDPELNQSYLSFATHYGFAANPCIPATPQHKGVVERDIRYTKHNALDGKRFNSLSEGNEYLRHWNKRWARTRIHGTTRCQVWKLFCDIEQPQLNPLPPSSFEHFDICKRKVDVSALIEVKRGFYRVPPRLIGQKVIVHFNQTYVKVYFGGHLIISHKRLEKRGTVAETLDFLPSWRHPDRESQERYYCRQARSISVGLHKIVYEVLCTEDPLAIRKVRGLLSIARKFPGDVVESACAKVFVPSRVRCKQFKYLCENCAETIQKAQQPELTQQHDLIRDLSEYENAINERTK